MHFTCVLGASNPAATLPFTERFALKLVPPQRGQAPLLDTEVNFLRPSVGSESGLNALAAAVRPVYCLGAATVRRATAGGAIGIGLRLSSGTTAGRSGQSGHEILRCAIQSQHHLPSLHFQPPIVHPSDPSAEGRGGEDGLLVAALGGVLATAAGATALLASLDERSSVRNSPQCLHFLAAARMVSAHHGHDLVSPLLAISTTVATGLVVGTEHPRRSHLLTVGCGTRHRTKGPALCCTREVCALSPSVSSRAWSSAVALHGP